MTTLALRDEFRRDPALPILVGDDVFIRGVRRGIEQGDYVYRRGELLFGPGDPPAGIAIDEQSLVFTMAYVIWPRQSQDGLERPGTSDDPPKDSIITGDAGTKANVPESSSFTAEGILKEALVQLWEQARAKSVEAIGVLTIRMFEAGDAFHLLGAIGAVSGAEKIVTIADGYETREGGSFELEFRGPVPDAQLVKEFLEPQLRDASSSNLQAGFELTFTDGLAMRGDAAETFTERLIQFASGAAYVSATAEAKSR